MSLTVLTNASSGATRNSGTNGDLCTLLDWALPQEGWAIEYTSGNARVYRPGSGIRNRLHVNHDSAVSGTANVAVIRGCENASAAATLIDPFPLVAQVPNNICNWLISTTANTTDRPFILWVAPTFFHYFSNIGSASNVWEHGMFGDPYPALSDPYGTIVTNRGTVSTSSINELAQATSTVGLASGRLFWMRDISGATKSSQGTLYASGSACGLVTGTASARAGYQNRQYRERVGVTDIASASTTPSTLSLVKRGYIPGLWSGLQNGRGTIDDIDTFTDTAYNPSAIFRQLPSANASSAGSMIIEMTDTWTPP